MFYQKVKQAIGSMCRVFKALYMIKNVDHFVAKVGRVFLNAKTKGTFTFCRVLERVSKLVIVAKNANKRLFLQKHA